MSKEASRDAFSHACLRVRNHCTCLGLHVSHNGVIASVARHGGSAMHIQPVTQVRGDFGLGNLGARSGRGAQVSATVVTAVIADDSRGGDYRRLQRWYDGGEIGDGSAVSAGRHLQLLLLLLLLFGSIVQRSEESRTSSVMQSSICVLQQFRESSNRDIFASRNFQTFI